MTEPTTQDVEPRTEAGRALDELRRLAEAATPGPWALDIDTEYGDYGSVLSHSLDGVRALRDEGRSLRALTAALRDPS